MKIGHFVPMIACKPGFERNVSGHVQAPLRAAGLQADAGHTVHLITTQPGPDRPALPHCLPENVPVHYVTDARKRVIVKDGVGGHTSGVRPLGLRRLVREVKTLARDLDLQVVHFHGYNMTACLAGGLRLAGLGRPTVASVLGLNARPAPVRLFEKTLMARADALTAATEYGVSRIRSFGLDGQTLRWGPIRDLRAELGGPAPDRRFRVLYWRDPSRENGADIVRDAYKVLAPKHPDLSFDLAVRPHWNEVEGLEALAEEHENVHLFRFPYPEGVSLPRLVLESVLVLMPFRQMSIDPQLVILESLAAGAPVLASAQRSNPEVVQAGKTGDLAPVGDADTTLERAEALLADRDRLAGMSAAAEADIKARWNWKNYVEESLTLYERVATGRQRGAARSMASR